MCGGDGQTRGTPSIPPMLIMIGRPVAKTSRIKITTTADFIPPSLTQEDLSTYPCDEPVTNWLAFQLTDRESKPDIDTIGRP